MNNKRSLKIILSLFLALIFILPISKSSVIAADDFFLEDWDIPEGGVIEGSPVTQTGISYVGVDSVDNKKLNFKVAYRAALPPTKLDWIYLRVDKRLQPYIEEINIKNNTNIGVKVGYQRYFELVTPETKADVSTTNRPTGPLDGYANADTSEAVIYRVPLDKNYLYLPGRSPKTRSLLAGNWGVFPNEPLEAERYEANLFIKLNKSIDEIRELETVDKFGIQYRLGGHKSNGTSITAKESLNKNTVVDFNIVNDTDDINSNIWLNSPVVHTITAAYEGTQMTGKGQLEDKLEGTGKTLLRVRSTIPNNLGYSTDLTLNKPLSLHISIDPKILELVDPDDEIVVWQVYRESNINKHDGLGGHNPIVLKKDMFIDGKIVLIPNRELEGRYDDGIYYIKGTESFLNIHSSSPFIGASIIDIPVKRDEGLEADTPAIAGSINTWFTDSKMKEVRNSRASSYINLYNLEINFYDDEDKTTKIKDTVNYVVTYKQEINAKDFADNYTVEGYTFISGSPETINIDKKEKNVLNLYYTKNKTIADTIDLNLPEKTLVNDINKISDEEKQEAIEKIKKANSGILPENSKVEILEDGSALITYLDDNSTDKMSKSDIFAQKLIVIKPIEKGEITNKDQTVVEKQPITDIVITPSNPDATVTVDETKLPEGVEYDEDSNTITGTPELTDWGNEEEERTFEIPVTITNPDGSKYTDKVVIVVQRDTDGDGIPDVVDEDDDNDGFTDKEEKEKGTDPKNPNNFPATVIKPIEKGEITNKDQTVV
ncbi:MAG: putative Ig domain-containing protein, partial [Helcococcus sp.]|nr:putative Ig domain-containing protein [Helcococcus sp.]